MTAGWTALVLTALGLGLLGPHRTRRLPPTGQPTGQPTGRAAPAPGAGLSAGARVGATLSAGVAIALVLSGWPGILLGAMAGVCADRVLRRVEPAAVARHRAVRAVELPVTLDLLAVCLRAGTPLVAAFEIVASALPTALAEDLRVVAALQRLGATPAAAWSDYAHDPVLGPTAAAVARSAESGSRLAEAFERLAADRRTELALEGEARARRAGVLAMAPLGLLFLPAFVCLGIVPLVLSIAATVLGGVS
jgi:pilus assembly protein TadC